MLHVTELATVDVLIISDMYLVRGVEHEFIFPFSWECHHPN